MTTTTLLDRALPAWDVSAELAKEMTGVRRIPGSFDYYNERFTARLKQLIADENPYHDRVVLESFLDDVQLAAVLDGTSFRIRQARFRSCVYSTGRIVHLQRHRSSTYSAPHDFRRYDDFSGFAQYPLCSMNGSILEAFDEYHYERLATTEKFGRASIPTGRVLPVEQMLRYVCERCAAIAHRSAFKPE